jgi:hypothetical protein
MGFPTQDGEKSYGSRFKTSRYDRENAPVDPGPRSEANKLDGKSSDESMPNADSRLHNNPHPEKFNTPLHGPGDAGGDGAAAAHTVTCPECGAQVSTDGGEAPTSHDDGQPPDPEAHDGKRQTPMSDNDADDYPIEEL